MCDACRAHFDAVKRYLSQLAVPFQVNPRIVRGLDYYTRTVFEFTSDALGAQSTVCAGGRYDDLVRSLGGPDVPAVGFGLGLERLLMTVDAAGTSAAAERSGIQVVALGDQARESGHRRGAAALLAARARFYGLRRPQAGAALKIADRNNARFALIVGSEELQKGQALLRDLTERTDRPVQIGNDLVPQLSAALAG